MIHNPALISGIYRSCTEELAALKERHDLSSYLDVNQLLTKSMLLACASFYEDEISRILQRVVESGNHPLGVQNWLRSVAVEGQFYKWFNFRSATNTNAFLALFGRDLKDTMRRTLDAKEKRKRAEGDFLELCQKRNECAHRNYAAYSLDLTIQEVYTKHLSAMNYVRLIEYLADKWLAAQSPVAGQKVQVP